MIHLLDMMLNFLFFIETSQNLSLLETLLIRCSHNNVFLLHVCSFRTKCSEISLVEEVYYHHSVGPICACVLPCHSTNFLWMSVSQSSFSDVCRYPVTFLPITLPSTLINSSVFRNWSTVFYSFYDVLQENLQDRAKQ